MLCAICKSSKYMQNMSIQSQNNKRLAKNTLILYARMLFTVGIGLFYPFDTRQFGSIRLWCL